MRNFKKISAVVVAAALTLTTYAPAFAAYSPVNGDKAAVLNQLDLYAGTDPNKFNPSLDSNLTRGQGAVLLAKLFNMDDAAKALTEAETNAILKDFADGAKVPDWAKQRMAYLVKNDIMAGSLNTTTGELNINTDMELRGGEFATLILKQMGYEVADWKTAIDQLAKVDGAKDVADYLAFGSTSILRDQAVGIIYGSLTADYAAAGTETVIDKIVAAKPAIKAAAEAAGLISAPVVLAVDSVKALNTKQVEIVFNQAMDKATAEDESYYEIKDKGTSTIALGSSSAQLVDEKTVVITLDGAATDKLTNSSDAKVTVKKDIKTASGLKLAADFVNSAVKVADGVIPSVTKVEATGENTLKISFSEPVYNGTNLTIGNQNITVKSGSYTYYVQNATADAAKKTITVTVGTKLIEGPITVTVNAAGLDSTAIQDYAGYKVFKGETTFTYTKDTTVPAVSVKEAKQESITLAFSKPVKAADLKLFHSVKDVAAYKATDVTTVGYVDEITFNFANKIPAGNVKLFLVNSTVSGNELVDGFGIKVPDQTINTSIVVDVTGPVVSSTKLNTNVSYEILFDEAIDATEATKTNNYSFKSVADGKDVSFSIAYNAVADAKKVTLNVPGNLSDNTQYQVVVKGMKDLSGNSMAAEAAYTFTVGDHTNPTVSDAYAVNADGKIYVVFSEPMNQAQMSDKTNYAVKTTTGAVFAALGTNDTLTVLSNKSILIDLADTTVSQPSLKIAGITDLAGKKLGTDVDFVYTAAVITDIAQEQVQIADAQLIAKNKIKLIFNKELSSFDNTEFAIYDNATHADFTPTAIRIQSVESMTKNADGNTEVILVLDQNLNTNAKFTTLTVDVETVSSPVNTKSISGTVLLGGAAKTVVDKLAPEVAKYDHDADAATADVAKVIASNFSVAPVNGRVAKDVTATVSVYFTENMKLSSMSTLTFSVDGYTVTGIALNADNSIVELSVRANADNTSATTSVTQNYNITDANDNVFAAGTVWTVR